MGFGAIITHGEGFERLDDAAMERLQEIRVEMELSKPTKYAIRFQEDICEGEPSLQRHTALQANKMLGIFVKSRDRLHCLVFGPITRVNTASMVGGSGGWMEVRGEDRRIVMNRIAQTVAWEGAPANIAKGVLSAYQFRHDVQDMRKQYAAPNSLNQRATDLAFLEDLARRNVMELWIEYEPADDTRTGPIPCRYTVNLKTSPHVQSFALVPTPPVLSAPQDFVIDVHPPPERCVRVTKFDTRIDFERPNAVRGFAIASRTGENVANNAEAQAPPINPDWTTLRDQDLVERVPARDPEPDPDDDYLSQQAALTEAAWFVEVDASSTLELLEFVVRPHMIVQVANAGSRLTGAYQVKAATHVINAADHFMDFKLRANGLGATPP